MSDETATARPLRYKRVLLKISGEALMGDTEYGIDVKTCQRFAEEIASARNLGVEICLVIGGGNIFRGIAGAAGGMERSQADSMGMLATIMNALAMQSALEQLGVETRVQSGIRMVRYVSRSSAAALYGIWKKAASLFSRQVQAIHTSQQIQAQPCARQKCIATR